MTQRTLQPLHDPQRALLLAELGALLHNVGKVSRRFITRYTRDTGSEPCGKAEAGHFSYEYIVGTAALLIQERWPQLLPVIPGADKEGTPSGLTGLVGDRIGKELFAEATQNVTTSLLDPVTQALLASTPVELPPPFDDRGPYALGDFIEFQNSSWYYLREPPEPGPPDQPITALFKSSYATWLFQRAHAGASGAEKHRHRRGSGNEVYQRFEGITRATAFGAEQRFDPAELTNERRRLLEALRIAVAGDLADPEVRRTLHLVAKETLRRGLGDTLRPINDVTVWDLGASAAALFKAGAAKFILEGQPKNDDALQKALQAPHPQWCFLSIRLNGLAFLGQAHHVTDLLGRQASLSQALDRIQQELEVVYPLGNEVYRDENGSIFVAPAISDLLDWPLSESDSTSLGKRLTSLFDETGMASAGRPSPPLDGEVEPGMAVSVPAFGRDLELSTVFIDPPPPLSPRQEQLKTWWDGNPTEQLCTVCQLRPQGYGVPTDGRSAEQIKADERKAVGRNVCYVCLLRRGRRSQQWVRSGLQGPTIWTDEAADVNGRTALVAGRFDLDPWLDGTLIRTLSVGNKERFREKNPSFARVRRVWETTAGFWQATRDKALLEIVNRSGPAGPRLRIRGSIQFAPGHDSLGLYHVYDLILGGRTLSAVWDPADKSFISADNLRYLARLLGQPGTGKQAADVIKRQLEEHHRTVPLEEAGGYGAQASAVGNLTITSVTPMDETYIPAISLLAEPRTFMAIVPAGAALPLARRIFDDYGEQMGRVRNRLRLDLGILYHPRRTPLPAVLDAGRRLLEMPRRDERWTVTGTHHDAAHHTMDFDSGVAWPFPAMMGDGLTPDIWYPYFTRAVAGEQRPDHSGDRMVHVTDLQEGDEVWVRPGRFDLEFLDTPAGRLRLSYDEGKDGKVRRQDKDRRHRPYWLDDLPQLTKLWDLLPGVQTGKPDQSQIHQLTALIESKRAAWGIPFGDEAVPAADAETPFARFVEDTLAQTSIGWWTDRTDEERTLLIRGACRGWLADIVAVQTSIAADRSALGAGDRSGQSGGEA